ncbi:MAG: YIP1 family protein [Planctomycetes bacterium]|nr:YIP1 family protein [Planctomycetota bacterium]
MILACPFCHEKVQKTASSCPSCRRVMVQRCPWCAEEISVVAAICKYCGEDVRTATPQAPPAVEFTGEVAYCPWEDRSKKGVFRRWWSTWAASQFSSGDFWRRLPAEGGHAKPHAYAWFLTVQMLALALPLFALVGLAVGLGHDAPGWAYAAGAAGYLALFPLTYVAVVMGNYVGAAIWHLVLKLLGGRGSYQGTLRIVAYNSGAAVWGLIPCAGGIVHLVMACVGNYHGFRAVHGLSKGRALFAALLPVFLMVAAAVTLIALIIAAETRGAI